MRIIEILSFRIIPANGGPILRTGFTMRSGSHSILYRIRQLTSSWRSKRIISCSRLSQRGCMKDVTAGNWHGTEPAATPATAVPGGAPSSCHNSGLTSRGCAPRRAYVYHEQLGRGPRRTRVAPDADDALCGTGFQPALHGLNTHVILSLPRMDRTYPHGMWGFCCQHFGVGGVFKSGIREGRAWGH